MRALLIVAHGSPRPEANDAIREVADTVRARARFDRVTVGYLDCNEPDIATAVDECVAGGATEIVVVPYFLHTGRHVLRDIPEILAAAITRHPGTTITAGPCIGAQPEIAGVILDRVKAAV